MGVGLHSVLSMSHREFSTWDAWLEEEWNRPNRSDHYLMQIAATAARILAKNPSAVKDADFKLKFEVKAPVGKVGDFDPEEAKRVSQAAMKRHLRGNTAKITRKTRPPEPTQN